MPSTRTIVEMAIATIVVVYAIRFMRNSNSFVAATFPAQTTDSASFAQ